MSDSSSHPKKPTEAKLSQTQTTLGHTNSTPPYLPTSTNSELRTLTFSEFSGLVENLLACPALNNPAGRNSVVSNLPANIRNAINYSPVTNAKQDMSNILQTCLNFPDGLAKLLEIVRFHDAGTVPLTKLEHYLQENNLNPH
jgi:hypothetical protein